MKKILDPRVSLAIFLAAAPLGAMAQTFFSDNFSNGSTVDQTPTSPTAISTSYQTEQGLALGSNTISANDLSMTTPLTGGIVNEFLALWTNSPAPLSAVGDYIDIRVVFTNTLNILSSATSNESANATINIGLFNSGGHAPNVGNVVLSVNTNLPANSGGTQFWQGYVGRIFWSGKALIFTRASQTAVPGTSQNEDLLFSNASGSQAFNNPGGTQLGSTTTESVTLTNGSVYTLQFVITMDTPSSLTFSNALYPGVGIGGTPIFSQIQGDATNTTLLTTSFDGMAVGWRNSSSASQVSTMDISSIQVIGQSSPVTNPPSITLQPVPVIVPTNGSCAFFVNALGVNMTNQWYRNGTNLIDGGNISGSQTRTLVISPAGTNDVLSDTNGYYIIISDGGGSTNSVTNSLTLVTATNLVWAGGVNINWDLDNHASWLDPNNNAAVFNFGDPVSFGDNGGNGGGAVTLTGPYLSAASVTVSNTVTGPYVFSGSGSFAGPGNLIYSGPVQLQIGNVNTYTGGTIISNASANLQLKNLSGLGTGPLTLAGGNMEIVPAGSSSSGINSDIIVADDFTIQFDGLGTYAGVFNGNLSGTTNKTLTLNPSPGNTTTNQRVRIIASTTYNANLALNGP